MEARDYIRPILLGLVAIGLVVLVAVLLVRAFTGGPSAPQVNFTQYANTPNATATLLIDGPTGVDQDHRQLKITVGNTQNEIQIIQGYQGNVAQTATYASNPQAFNAFLQTLKLLNFAKGKAGSTNDAIGYCPAGERYYLSFNNGTTTLFNYWATSCGGQGTAQGNIPIILQQFSLQIPQASLGQLTGDLPFGV